MTKKHNKKQKVKKKLDANKLSKFTGKDLTKLPKNFLHYGLVELKRERVKNWYKIFEYGSIKITQSAPESPNMYDKTILINILRALKDKEIEQRKIVKDDVLEKKAASGDENAIKDLNLIERKGRRDVFDEHNNADAYIFNTFYIDFNEFCYRYVGGSRESKNNILDSIERLLHCKTTYRQGTREFETFHYIVDFNLDKETNIARFTVSKQLKESAENGLGIHYDTFSRIKSPIGKSLYLFFIGGKNIVFSYATIKFALGLTDEEIENRKLIIRGLNELVNIKFIKSFEIQTRRDDIYYLLTYGIIDKVNQGFIDDIPSEPLQIAVLQGGVNDDPESVNDDPESVNDDPESVNDNPESVNDNPAPYVIY